MRVRWKKFLFILSIMIIYLNSPSNSIIKIEEKKPSLIDEILKELNHEDLPRLHDHRILKEQTKETTEKLTTDNYYIKKYKENTSKNVIHKELKNINNNDE